MQYTRQKGVYAIVVRCHKFTKTNKIDIKVYFLINNFFLVSPKINTYINRFILVSYRTERDSQSALKCNYDQTVTASKPGILNYPMPCMPC